MTSDEPDTRHGSIVGSLLAVVLTLTKDFTATIIMFEGKSNGFNALVALRRRCCCGIVAITFSSKRM